MRAKVDPRLKLAILAALIVALVGAVLFTPLGYWVAGGAAGLWQRFLGLPGIAWARQQMGETGEGSTEVVSGQDAEAINSMLEAGHALQQGEAYEEALRRYREALNLDEEYAPTHVALAGLYMQLGREDDALAELEKAAALAPDNVFVLGQLGKLYLQRDEFEKGVDALERAAELDPDDAILRYWLGVAYHYRSYTDVQKAVSTLEEAAQIAPDEAEIHYHLAMAYVRRDDDLDEQKAIRALIQTLKLDPTQTEAYYYLGQLYIKTAERDAGIAAWEHYVAESDDAESVEKVRGWLRNMKAGAEPGSGS